MKISFKTILLACGVCIFGMTAHANADDDFWRAIKRDDVSTIRTLQLRQFNLNKANASGDTGLHDAIASESVAVASYLIEQPGIHVNALNRNGESPLMLAAIKGQLGLVKRLVAQGAQVNLHQWAPLHYACSHDSIAAVDIVALLLDKSAYIDAESPNGTTPLMMAARYGVPEVLSLLLQEGADASLTNELGLTALDFAQQGQRPSSIEILKKSLRK
jgi:hypothetical protein